MKLQDHSFYFASGVALAAFAVVFATPPIPSYSVNVHFIPPLVEARCTFLQFWNPPNLTCAMCFCFTGRLSRCVPQPGCDPANATTSTTTPAPGPSTAPIILAPNATHPNATEGSSPGSTSTTVLPPSPDPTTPATTPTPTTTSVPSTSTNAHVRKIRSPRIEKLRKRI